jgi:hypothetical protein
MKQSTVQRLFRSYADRPETIPALIVALALRDARAEPSEENETMMRAHLQQVFWLASRGLEPVG